MVDSVRDDGTIVIDRGLLSGLLAVDPENISLPSADAQ